MGSSDQLRALLRRIDGGSYKAYRDLRGEWSLDAEAGLPGATLFVDHVQGDPFASPSRLRLRVAMESARVPTELYDSRARRIALCDYTARCVADSVAGRERRAGSGKSGLVSIDSGAQAVLERSAVEIDPEWIEARIEVGLPAAGRRVLGRGAERLLLEVLPGIAGEALCAAALDSRECEEFVAAIDAQEWIRGQLGERGLVAFVADGSILPRESGASDRPMRRGRALPFASPESLAVDFELPEPVRSGGAEIRTLRGLGIRRGVTLIAGGGYHGKSTLLQALERAVHPHVPGDGRHWVVSDAGLTKIRAEDGRAVTGTDIRNFVRELPAGRGETPRSTAAFSTGDASGSTSQAAGIVEAIEAGASGLLLDEDTCATNLMIRDARMQALVARDAEPITPFLERVRSLHDELGVSTVMVMGGSGDYFEVADTVLQMQNYEVRDATADAHSIAQANPRARGAETDPAPFVSPKPRIPTRDGFDPSSGRRDVKIGARGLHQILYGRETIELRGLEQLVDPSQTRAIAGALLRLDRHWIDAERTLPELLDALDRELDRRGLDLLDPFHRPEHHPGNLARPRRQEIAAALSRMRSLQVKQLDQND